MGALSRFTVQKAMLLQVAKALAEYCDQVTFVGGCTTGLLITDAFIQEQVRATEDVDLIVSVISYLDFQAFRQKLIGNGFREMDVTDSEALCHEAWFIKG